MQKFEASARHGLLLVAVAWLAPIGSTLFAPVLPHMIAHFADVPNAALLAPIALVTPALLVALLAPLAGMLTDRIGRQRILMASLALYALAGVAPFWLDNLYVIILTRAVVGIAEAGVMTASTALICDYFTGRRRAHWLSVQFGSASLVATVCFVLAGILGGYDWRAPFLVYGATALFIPLIFLIIFEPVRGAGNETPAQSPQEDDQRLFTARFIGCLGITLVCGALFYVTPVHISLVLSERGIADPAMLGLASAIGSLGVVAGATIFRFQSKRSIGILLIAALAAQSLGFVILYTQPSLIGGVVGMFINNVGCGVSLPLVLAYTMSRLPNAYRGRASGAWTSMFFIGQFVCPLWVSAVSTLGGGMVAAMAFFATFTGFVALLLVMGFASGRALREPAATGAPIIATH
ncbi:MFS transporter [Rhizobium sp. CG5]|uniref:MFS transporter n=1 Tax=Rhizobium sp. CG5 TaxID=2726076 RepID=UPI002034483B|nr:MFS transporter [Rhizobium sp. CG5]MCM2474570.1 MFS transporter [Rhizobium sp. CG5]